MAPDVPGFEIDPEEEIEDPYSDENKTPDEDKEIPDIDRPNSNLVKLSSISPSSTGRVSPTETTTSMKKDRVMKLTIFTLTNRTILKKRTSNTISGRLKKKYPWRTINDHQPRDRTFCDRQFSIP